MRGGKESRKRGSGRAKKCRFALWSFGVMQGDDNVFPIRARIRIPDGAIDRGRRRFVDEIISPLEAEVVSRLVVPRHRTS